MKQLREQFKQMEKSYLKPTIKKGSFSKERKSNFLYNNKNDTYDSNSNNSNIYNPNLQGSYNSNSKNNNGSAGGSFQNYMLRENSNSNDPFFEEFTNIKMLWDDLGVTENYQIIFENLSRDIDPIMRQDLFEHENNSLGKFSELLLVNII